VNFTFINVRGLCSTCVREWVVVGG